MIQPRRHLRSDVTAEVQERLLSGLLPVGRINESELAADLGISRTPLREALLVMEQRGLVESAMGRGFLVRALTIAEAEELYPLLAVLEPMALRLGAAALAVRCDALRALVLGIRKAASASEMLALSQRWNAEIVGACPNRKLASLLRDLHRLSTRYERRNIDSIGAEGGFPVEPAIERHLQLIDAIASGDLDRAARMSAESWQQCLAALRIQLATNDTEGDPG